MDNIHRPATSRPVRRSVTFTVRQPCRGSIIIYGDWQPRTVRMRRSPTGPGSIGTAHRGRGVQLFARFIQAYDQTLSSALPLPASVPDTRSLQPRQSGVYQGTTLNLGSCFTDRRTLSTPVPLLLREWREERNPVTTGNHWNDARTPRIHRQSQPIGLGTVEVLRRQKWQKRDESGDSMNIAIVWYRQINRNTVQLARVYIRLHQDSF